MKWVDSMLNDMIDCIVMFNNVELLMNKGLYVDDRLSDKFYTLYENYKVLLEKYLFNKLSLGKYEDRIDNSGLLFVPVNKNDMDIYQYISSLGLKYIYLRSNLYVDKLELNDIDMLVNLSNEEISNPNDKLLDLIERTYKNIIDSRYDDDKVISMNCYGPDSNYYWFPSSELIFGIRFDDFADNGLGEEDEWEENFDEQMQFVGNIINELNNTCSDILGIKVNFVYYDDVSVVRSMKR